MPGKIWTPKRPPIIGADNIRLGSLTTRKPSGEWNPKSISDCALWLRSDLGITKDGSDRVSAWADQSESGFNLVQATQDNQPIWTADQINGEAALVFDGSNDYLEDGNVAELFEGDDLPFTFFCVAKNTADVLPRMFFHAVVEGGSAPTVRIYVSDGGPYYFWRLDTLGAGTPISAGTGDNNWHYFTCVFTGTTVSLWVDGVIVINNAAYDTGTMGFSMDLFWLAAHAASGDPGSPDDHWMGPMAEAGFYSKEISTAERGLLETYLADRYAL